MQENVSPMQGYIFIAPGHTKLTLIILALQTTKITKKKCLIPFATHQKWQESK
jgi:hypothetical protein